MKKIIDETIYQFVYILIRIVGLLPMQVLYALSTFAFIQIYYLFPYRRKVVIQNISRSFPEKRYGEVGEISRQFYRSFIDYFAEIIKATSSPAGDMRKRIEFENFELVTRHTAEGKNVIACMGHCGNWEMMSILPLEVSVHTHAVYQPLSSLSIDKLMRKIRSRFGMRLIPAQSVVRHILSNKANPSLYLFLADQCPVHLDERFRFPFLNQITYSFPGAEKLARSTGSAVVYIHVMQTSRGCYRMTCLPLCDDALLTSETEITHRYVNLLEENIQERPHGWLWTHKRWKR